MAFVLQEILSHYYLIMFSFQKSSFSFLFACGALHVLFFFVGVHIASAYSSSGYKWSGTSANYYIQSAFSSSFRTAMQSADASWDAAGSKFKLSYSGTTTRNPDVWHGYALDGYSDIGYYNDGNTGHLATTSGGVSGKTLTERDTTLNTYYSFTTVGTAGSYDVQNTFAHEFGHWLKLLDVTSSGYPSWCSLSVEDTMCSDVISVGETHKRSLETDDKNGIKAIYGT